MCETLPDEKKCLPFFYFKNNLTKLFFSIVCFFRLYLSFYTQIFSTCECVLAGHHSVSIISHASSELSSSCQILWCDLIILLNVWCGTSPTLLLFPLPWEHQEQQGYILSPFQTFSFTWRWDQWWDCMVEESQEGLVITWLCSRRRPTLQPTQQKKTIPKTINCNNSGLSKTSIHKLWFLKWTISTCTFVLRSWVLVEMFLWNVHIKKLHIHVSSNKMRSTIWMSFFCLWTQVVNEERRGSKKSPDSSSTCSSREPSPVTPRPPNLRRQSTTEVQVLAHKY